MLICVLKLAVTSCLSYSGAFKGPLTVVRFIDFVLETMAKTKWVIFKNLSLRAQQGGCAV